MRVVWDLSHREFSIEDYYYFSKLKRLLEEKAELIPARTRDLWEKADVLVLNYPEEPLKERELELIDHLLKTGTRVIALAYYDNHDEVQEVLNDLLKPYGMKFAARVEEPLENYGNDPLFPIFTAEGLKIVLPCSAEVRGGRPIAVSASGRVGAAKSKDLELFAVGSCVFWDNFSIELLDNKELAKKLLKLK